MFESFSMGSLKQCLQHELLNWGQNEPIYGQKMEDPVCIQKR